MNDQRKLDQDAAEKFYPSTFLDDRGKAHTDPYYIQRRMGFCKGIKRGRQEAAARLRALIGVEHDGRSLLHDLCDELERDDY